MAVPHQKSQPIYSAPAWSNSPSGGSNCCRRPIASRSRTTTSLSPKKSRLAHPEAVSGERLLTLHYRRHSPIALGEAVVTPGFELPNSFVIHTRAASFINDDHPEIYLDLALAQTLRVAKEAGIKSMAMPAIGTGVFKFPPELSAEIIINCLVSRSEDYPEIHLVRICVGTQEMKAVFASTLAAKISSPA